MAWHNPRHPATVNAALPANQCGFAVRLLLYAVRISQRRVQRGRRIQLVKRNQFVPGLVQGLKGFMAMLTKKPLNVAQHFPPGLFSFHGAEALEKVACATMMTPRQAPFNIAFLVH